MEREPNPVPGDDGWHRPHASAALVVSVQSVVWTVLSSSAAIVLGVQHQTAVLVALGAVGYVDAIGSVALAYHFGHGLRHDQLSERLEALAHRVVLIGLVVVGTAAIIGGAARFVNDASTDAPPTSAIVLAAASLGALIVLSARKQAIAGRVRSPALRSDGHLSAVGAAQAAVALAGTGVDRWLGWQWADALATVAVGCVAVALALVTWRSARRV